VALSRDVTLVLAAILGAIGAARTR
jgi:hypothetical protein